MKRPCFVHSGRNDIIAGFIESVDDKTIDVHIYGGDDEEDYLGTCYKTDVIWNQQPYISVGRYIALRKTYPKKIHLCTCVWTKEDIELVSIRAAQIAVTIS